MTVPTNVAWSFIEGSAANFRTHDLIEVDANRIEFRRSRRASVFGWSIVVPSLSLCLYCLTNPAQNDLGIVFTLTLSAFVSFMFLIQKIHVFDRQRGYSSGRNNPRLAKPLDQIAALQLLHNMIRPARHRSYRAAQINLCFRDGSRQTIVCHSDLEELHAQAVRLAAFLSVPLANLES